MLRMMCKSKIHRAVVTEANLKYEGSITIDTKLMEAADMLAGEMVMVVNLNTGDRFHTYVIEGKRNSGIIGLNGGAARLGQAGDELIIISYGFMNESELVRLKPKFIQVNSKNKIIRRHSLK
jgi:aspartate 1-decarboxylase